MEKIQHWFLHVDLDAFFASVEQLDHPEYRGKPVIVGGKPEDRRSVVSTASYEARKFGVHSAMPTAQAYKLCPQGIYVYGRMERYAQLSYCIMEILKNYSPDVNQMSIDEAFLDITGTEKLFGPPETVAKKIKDEIFENTGLTVSIGLAQSKYHAKIASDINKPNGFYCVKPGTEEEFMLNLPLKKVFGVGTKSLEKLNNCGIKTTRDIHEKTLEYLQYLCGENQGQFLYDVVRGKSDDERFGKEAKNHSISAETTFAYDVNDIYTLETVILNLAYSIIFRLLKEKGFSRTAFIKIRYEDFSTVSIQQTFDKNIISLDNYYDILKNLFERKWEKNRGVRLLGVGLDNIETEDRPMQQELFDDGSEKKQKVEKAILQMTQKHPELKVHKARMMQNIKKGIKTILFFFLFATSIFSQKIYAQETVEEKESSYKYNITGFWEAGFTGNFQSTFGNNTDFVFSTDTPVFKQAVDLTANFSFGSNWNFYLNFADNFNKNTYTVSYTADKYLKNFIFSNRNIIFPKDYSSSQLNTNPGGGNNEAPGILFHWEDYKNEKYSADFVLRYDMTNQEKATFYGKNKVTDVSFSPFNYVKSKFFIIPDGSSNKKIISKIQNIYIETDNNSLSEVYYSKGQAFKKLDSSEYLIIAQNNLLILSNSVIKNINNNPQKIIVTFNNPSAIYELKEILGNYNQSDSYLGKLQTFFNESSHKINLSSYAYNIYETINGENGIVIQNSKGFSPFIFAGAYEIGKADNCDIFVVNSITNQKINTYSSSTTQLDLTQLSEDFFKEKNHIISIYNTEVTSSDFELPENRYPFAKDDPLIYLSNQNEINFSILKRSYTSVSNFDIGKDVESSSVAVMINGIPTHNFTYSHNSGFITLNQNINETDRIDITWNKQASSADNGTIVAGAGFKYKFSENVFSDTILSTRIPFNPFVNYGTYGSNHASYVALTSGIDYSKDNLTIMDSISLSVENPNITDTYIVNQINTSGNKTYYNSKSSSHETKAVPLISDVILDKNAMGNNNSAKAEEDNSISGYKVPVSWNFSTEENWTSVDISLSQADLLCNSNQFNFAIKNESSDSLENYDFYFQLGIICSNEKEGLEEKIPVWKLTSLIDLSEEKKNQWQIISVSLSSEQQAAFISQKDARLIIYKKSSATENAGKISFGPYEYIKKAMTVNADENISVSSTLDYSPLSPAAKKYFSSSYYADTIYWEKTGILSTSESAVLKTTTYFQAASFNDYENIHFDFAFTPEKTETGSTNTLPGFKLLLDDAVTSLPAIELEILQEAIESFINESFHTLTINTKLKTVSIDGLLLAKDQYILNINNLIAPTRQQLFINTNINNNVISKGKFTAGSLYYTGINFNFNIKNIFQVNYSKKEIITNKNKEPVLYNGFINLISNQSDSITFDEHKTNLFFTDALLQTGISFLKIDFSTHILLDFNTFSYFDLKNFGYAIKNDNPFFQIIQIRENYDFNKQNLQTKKEDFISLNFSKHNVPLEMSLNITGDKSQSKTQQKYDSSLYFEIPINKTKLISKTTFNLNEKINNSGITEKNFPNIWDSYINLYSIQFSDGKAYSSQRNASLSENISYTITKNINPQLNYSIASTTSNTQLQNFTNTSNLGFTIPFKIKNNNFSFGYTKKASSLEENTKINSYRNDISYLFENQANISWLYTSIPFYDLFDQSLSEKLLKNDVKSNSYNAKYSFSWNRSLYSSVKDIYIPAAFSTSVTRDIITSSNINDIYQIKSTLNYKFLNLLGSKGKLHIFDFFSQDEYLSAITAQIKIPQSSSNSITWSLNFNEALLLYIDTKNTIKATSDFTISGLENWQFSFGTLWTHTGNNSLLIMIPALFYNKINEMSQEISRTENIMIMFGTSNGKNKQEYKYIHGCDVSLNKNITISTTLGTVFNYTQDKALSLNLEYYLGGKLSF